MPRQYTVKKLPAAPASGVDYAAELNEQQFSAVTAPPGPSLVIAGAGSGKTRTLTYRVAYLLDNGIAASNILLLTFTNKAAREMLERVEHLVPRNTKDLWGGTFHSVCNRILRRHADLLGYEKNFTILDTEDQKDLVNAALTGENINPKRMRFPKAEVLMDIFSLGLNTSRSIPEVLEWKYPYYEDLAETLAQIQEIYEKKKFANNSMDFDDLLIKTLKLFEENPTIRSHYQKQFDWVLVDEYQDTNAVQSELIDLLAAPLHNLMVVGDDAQSIYSWRGADFRNILDFPERYENARKYVIETNYRSVPEILFLANEAIKPNRQQVAKTLAPARSASGELPALAPLADVRMQAQFVAQRIEELIDEEGLAYADFAVLYRAHFHSMEVQLELTRRGIPFNITSGLRFFEQAHIKDVAAFMKLAINRKDEVAFKRIVKFLPGIGSGSADKLWQQWIASPVGKETALKDFSSHLLGFKIPSKAKEDWKQFAYTLDELLDERGEAATPSDMIQSVTEGIYDEYLKSKYPNYDARKQDLAQLRQFAGGFTDTNEFLAQLSLLAGQDAVEANRKQKETDAVTLSSVHQAKGLEYKVVFVIWLAENMFPSKKVLENDDEDERGLEEERRLFYVAVTRAMDQLYLTYPRIWQNSYSGDVIQRPSLFLEGLPENAMEIWEVGSARW